MPIHRWKFVNLKTGEQWTVPKNPNAMTSPFPERKFVVKSTTAGPGLGTSVVYEAVADPKPWEFSGNAFDLEHVNALLHWSQVKNKVKITDHFGRTFIVLIDSFEPIPKQAASHMQRHTYTMRCTVFGYIPAP